MYMLSAVELLFSRMHRDCFCFLLEGQVTGGGSSTAVAEEEPGA